MNLVEFQKKSSRTFASLGSKENDLLHCQVGIITELGELLDCWKKVFAYGQELNIVNVQEEIGDTLFYIANYLNIKGEEFMDFEFLTEYEEAGLSMLSKKDSVSYIDFIKELFSYSLGDTQNLESEVNSLAFVLKTLLKSLGLSLEETLQKNVDKLLKRFPEGFSEEKASNRDLEGELKILSS